jgi:non-lysosomal glucosylceramidase
MADVIGDTGFASQCRAIAGPGAENLVRELFDDGYFINKVDPKRPDTINSGTGCHIDQAFGQSWAFQVGLPRVLPETETLSALKSLWRYNFTPDAGYYRKTHKPGRWYAMAGEAGLLMCTFPRRDWDYGRAAGKGPDWAAGYFNECMNGFEYQVAGHMIREGMVMEGLAITRAVHDRYHPSKRNPWNEVECGDHYARSMASYGVYLAACGYEYDGPAAHIGFAPKLTPADFKCAFTAAEGWGSYRAKDNEREIALRHGSLRLKTLALGMDGKQAVAGVRVSLDGRELNATHDHSGSRTVISFAEDLVIHAGETMRIVLT